MSNINNLITDFSVEQLRQFFRGKIAKFKPIEESYDFLFEDKEEILDNFTEIIKIGEAELNNNDDLLVITAKTNKKLTNRTGKKRQYEIAKNILKEENNDAAFFIFYDENNNFRFSFIRANFLGAKRDFTNFKRYTYFVSKEQTNKTFISQISKADFKDLDSIQEAFSVEPLTKQFYEKLQHWYFWAIDNVKFPEDAEEEKNGKEIAIIRLITRLIFIWFMKVRNLIPNDLFDEENIKNILDNFADEDSTYYKAFLQNLFFATLNTKQVDRKFRNETRGHKGFNPDFGNQNVFRYHDLFKDPESLKTLFEKIPFLNGGLFECLDYKTKDKDERKYIDGFTATKGKQPTVPNFLFFSEVQKKDISKFYGKKNKTYEVEGLINLLKSYNFTIDENEADDIEVALDPELLGSIFENLLASYNPETATTARKATGSFYTPREIVNYMTNESLKQYFLTHLNNTEQLDAELDNLIKSQTNENPFDETTSKKITKLIDSLRVVDPAVGSGAFPMAVLNKLVFILSKIDPENTFWKNSQIAGIKKSVSDPVIQRKLIEQTERQFQEKNADYGRKLYLIEKCIYGVDIQQIAVEIAKLRFFISLLVDEKIKWDKPENNYGIEPLPNLDFKLMQGNSLISSFTDIDFDKTEEQKEDSLFDLDEANTELITEFEELKNEYQNESDREKKNALREKIEKCIYKIVEDKIAPQLRSIEEKFAKFPNQKILIDNKNKIYITKEEAIKREKQQLGKKLGYDIMQIEKDLKAFTEGRKSKDFFLWKIYFAEVFTQKGGFDIVIGNPPYVSAVSMARTKLEKSFYKKKYPLATGTYDIYILFLLKAIDLLNINGKYSWIIPNKFLIADYAIKTKQYLENNGLQYSVDVSTFNVFKNTSVYPIIVLGNKTISQSKLQEFLLEKYTDLEIKKFKKPLKLKNHKTFKDFSIKISSGATGFEAGKIKTLVSDKNTTRSIPFTVSGCVDRYEYSNQNVRFMGLKLKSAYITKSKILAESKWSFWVSNKIVVAGMTKKLEAVFVKEPLGLGVGIYGIYDYNNFEPNFLTAILNSNYLSFYFRNKFRDKHLAGGYLAINKSTIEKLPLVFTKNQQNFTIIVDNIISKKELGEDTKELEDKIDIMVYKLYELTYEEVIIVDPEFWLSKKEYENYEIGNNDE